MSLPRKLDETRSDQNDSDDRRVKELKTKRELLFFHDAIKAHRMQDVFKVILKDHVHPEAELPFGFQPLWVACASGNLEIAEFLIMNGACVNGRLPYFIPLVGILACSHSSKVISKGQEACVKLLVRHKADVSAKNHNGYTSLMFAAPMSAESTVELLLEHQADVNATKDGKTALEFAREHDATPEVIGLLEAANKMSLRK